MRGVVNTGNVMEPKRKGFFKRDPKRFVPVPSTAMVMHKVLVEKMDNLKQVTNNSPLNQIINRKGKVGVVKMCIRDSLFPEVGNQPCNQ